MKAVAQIKAVKWETSIWFDSKQERYILPVKAEIRKKAQLVLDQTIEMTLWV